ncbi:Hypothetical predicted protein, partial [Pelobates cultripes]
RPEYNSYCVLVCTVLEGAATLSAPLKAPKTCRKTRLILEYIRYRGRTVASRFMQSHAVSLCVSSKTSRIFLDSVQYWEEYIFLSTIRLSISGCFKDFSLSHFFGFIKNCQASNGFI